MLDKLRAQAARHPNWMLVLITAVALLPFVAKPFNIDDPLFVWVAKQIHAQAAGAKYGHGPGALWFEGHWGFHYYMEQAGGSPVDFKRSPLKFGDIIVVPFNNTNLKELDPKTSTLLETLGTPVFGEPAAMSLRTGAGFYSSVWGPLPFAFGHVPPEYVRVYELRKPSVATPGNPK